MRVGSHIRTIPNDWHMLNLGRRPLATLGAGLTTVEHTTQIVYKYRVELCTFEPILSTIFFKFFTFILGGQFLLPLREEG